MNNIKLKKFSEIDFSSSFFKTLFEDYKGFGNWIEKKKEEEEKAYILEENEILGFLYLKEEEEEHVDITPYLEIQKRLKVGTFKVKAHGTKIGERFIKIILDNAMDKNIDEVYVTIFEKHEGLIKLLKNYGFKYYGDKKTESGIESVYLKKLNEFCDDIYIDYPMIKTFNNKKHLLAIMPKFHTNLFPDSKLNTEKDIKLEDVSHTNSIRKVYICAMDHVLNFKKGDVLVIYRMKDYGKSAYFSSVATSISVVEEVKNINEFSSCEEFCKYCGKFTIFTDQELLSFWNSKRYPYIVKMLYNISFNKRIVRKKLIEKVGIEGEKYWGAFELEEEKFNKILELGEVNENFIINKA